MKKAVADGSTKFLESLTNCQYTGVTRYYCNNPGRLEIEATDFELTGLRCCSCLYRLMASYASNKKVALLPQSLNYPIFFLPFHRRGPSVGGFNIIILDVCVQTSTSKASEVP